MSSTCANTVLHIGTNCRYPAMYYFALFVLYVCDVIILGYKNIVIHTIRICCHTNLLYSTLSIIFLPTCLIRSICYISCHVYRKINICSWINFFSKLFYSVPPLGHAVCLKYVDFISLELRIEFSMNSIWISVFNFSVPTRWKNLGYFAKGVYILIMLILFRCE